MGRAQVDLSSLHLRPHPRYQVRITLVSGVEACSNPKGVRRRRCVPSVVGHKLLVSPIPSPERTGFSSSIRVLFCRPDVVPFSSLVQTPPRSNWQASSGYFEVKERRISPREKLSARVRARGPSCCQRGAAAES